MTFSRERAIRLVALAVALFLALLPLAHDAIHAATATNHHALTCPLAMLARVLPVAAVPVVAAAILHLAAPRLDRGAVYAPAPVIPLGRPRAPPPASF